MHAHELITRRRSTGALVTPVPDACIDGGTRTSFPEAPQLITYVPRPTPTQNHI